MLQTFTSTRIARFGSGGAILRSRDALTDDQIKYAAPSVFALEKHGSRSDRYTYIPTSEVLAGLRREGFQPYEVRQGGSRDDEKRSFTKHMIRLRRDGAAQVGDSLREIILLNAHDGTSSYQLMSGLFRLVCSNGLVVSEGDAQGVRIPHKGDIISQVIEGAYQVIDEGAVIDQRVTEFRNLMLSAPEQNAFALAAAELRFEEGKVPVAAEQINQPRRRDDTGADLWSTFNRSQENLMRGGVHYIHRNAEGRIQSRNTRPVNGIEGNLSLNRALWTLATKMAEIKAA